MKHDRRLCQAFPIAALFAAAHVAQSFASPPQDEVFGDDLEGFNYPACDTGLVSDSSDPAQYAAALDVCGVVTQQSGKPGLIGASLTLPDGSGTPSNLSYAIRSQFGAANTPRYGSSMVVLSTGHAATPTQTNPSYANFEPGIVIGTSSAPPSDWLSAHGGVIPTTPGCPGTHGTTAYDPVMLSLTLRVPGDAHSFSVAVNFYSADYPEYVCGDYTDQFVALLDSVFDGGSANPSDRNIAQYFAPGQTYSLNVNLAMNTGLFAQCVNGHTGCMNTFPVIGTTSMCTDPAALAGTGMDIPDATVCDANSVVGGGTGWLVLRGNVVPGEVIHLRFALWDASDGLSDSVVLLDNLHWSHATATPGLTQN